MTSPADAQGETAEAVAGPLAGGAPGRRILVVWNQDAGTKAGIPTNGIDEAELRALMDRHGLGDELFSGTEEAARDRVREAVRDGYDIVVAAGGDGTAGLVARELLGRETALAILPLGSLMNLRRSLDIPLDPDDAAAVVRSGTVRSIDIGSSGERMFLEMASIGLSAQLFGDAHDVDHGRYGSVIDMVRVLFRHRPTRIRLVLDGRPVSVQALMVCVAIGPYTGVGLTLAPEARLDDGLFDVVVYRGFSRWELIRHLLGIVAGRRRASPKVTTFRARRVLVEARRPLPVRADASDLGTTPVSFEVRPGLLRVIAPSPSADPDTGPETGPAEDAPSRRSGA
ncbi:MAG TPA: diacylglycerol kinase family protein [Candidatus Limnocylindrales bacterium]